MQNDDLSSADINNRHESKSSDAVSDFQNRSIIRSTSREATVLRIDSNTGAGSIACSAMEATKNRSDEKFIGGIYNLELQNKLKQEKQQRHNAALLITITSFCGFIILSSMFFVRNRVVFFCGMAFGLAFMFASNAGIGMIVMLSVPAENRSLAIAMNNIFIHVFGDVPSPIIAGLLKDKLAPGCAGANDDGKCINDFIFIISCLL